MDDRNAIFNLNEVVTLYNLDFCDNIKFPYSGINKNGVAIEISKFDAIKRLLEIQNSLNYTSTKFVLFLTVHASYRNYENEIHTYLAKSVFKEYYRSITKFLKGKGHDRNARILRLYIVEQLQRYFLEERFIAEFLPTLFYKGIKDAPILLFTVIGTKNHVTMYEQDINNLITQKFLTTEGSTFINHTLDEVSEIDITDINPVTLLQNSHTYQNYWI